MSYSPVAAGMLSGLAGGTVYAWFAGEANAVAPAVRTVTALPASSPLAREITLTGLFTATALLIVSFAVGRKTERPADDDPDAPIWKPNESWASNLSVLAGVVGTATMALRPGSGAMRMTAVESAALIAVFGITALLAPAVVAFISALSKLSPAVRGTAFFVGPLFTLTGAFGQITVLVLLVLDAWSAKLLPSIAISLLVVALGIVWVTLCAYVTVVVIDAFGLTAAGIANAKAGIASDTERFGVTRAFLL